MNASVQKLERQIAQLLATITALKEARYDVSNFEIYLKVLSAQYATAKANERLEMFSETNGDDRYSARRAAALYRKAAAHLKDAARKCDELAADPHAEVLKQAGIQDA